MAYLAVMLQECIQTLSLSIMTWLYEIWPVTDVYGHLTAALGRLGSGVVGAG